MTTILGIESTAHTFGVSVVKGSTEEFKGEILSDIRSIFKPEAGKGIHPSEASNHHASVAHIVVRDALEKVSLSMEDIDAIAFSMGPGLGPCLRVGAVVARTLSAYWKKPLVPVNHAIGHIELSSMLTGFRNPLVLLVSGGHTLITSFSTPRWRILGETLDLTIGQLLDQVGREAGFGSPCGAEIEILAARSSNYISLPYVVKGNDMSFSGILTASKKMIRNRSKLEDVAFSVQETAFAILGEATERALAFTEAKELLIVGGVAANKRLRQVFDTIVEHHEASFAASPPQYSGDCGAQIGWTGLLAYESGVRIQVEESGIRQSWRLDRVEVPWRSLSKKAQKQIYT